MIISGNAQRILKILHLLAVSFWIGGYLSQVILYYICTWAESGDELFGVLRGSRFVGMFVVVYLGAYGSFFTGLAYSMCTHRGFFRHKWIIIKWGTTVYLMIVGSYLLGPWSATMLETTQAIGLEALNDPDFILSRSRLLSFFTVHMFLFVILTIVSVYKPWETAESIRLLNKKLRVEK